VVAVSSCRVRAHAASGFVVGCRVAASIGVLMGLLGWYWEGPVEIVVGLSLEFVGAEDGVGLSEVVSVAGGSGVVVASSLVDCSSEDWLLQV